MDWLLGRRDGGAPQAGGAGDAGETQPLVQPLGQHSPGELGREVSFGDVLQAAQQAPVETAVLNGSKHQRHGASAVVCLSANASSKQPPPDVTIRIVPDAPSKAAAADAKAGATSSSGSAGAVKAAAYGLTNLSSVVAIVFANKLVLYTHGFGFAATLTWLHCIFTALGMMLMAGLGVFDIKRVPLARSAPIAAVYVGAIVLNNLSIQLNTVGFYQISKIAITPVVVAIEWACYGKAASPRVLASIAVLLTGIALATVTDSQVSSRPLGVAVASVNVAVTGLYQVWAGSKQRELGLNGLQLLHQVSPCSVVLLALLIPCLEPVGFSNPGPGTVLGYHLTPAAGFWIVVSSVLGLVVTLSTFLFIGATSSLTYNVVGHLKTVLIVGGGVVLFGDSMGLKKLIGLGIAMSGIVWYSHIKMADAANKAPGKQ